MVWAVTVIATWIGASGQMDIWGWAGEDPHDPRRWGIPAMFELGVIAWLLIGRTSRRSPFLWWGIAAVFAAGAVAANVVHHTPRRALIFGVASGVALSLWFAKFYLEWINSQVDKEHREGARPKVLLTMRTIMMPRVRWRAALLIANIPEINGVGQAIKMARRWRFVHQDVCANPAYRLPRLWWTRPDRLRARNTAWNEVYRQLGLEVVEAQGVRVATVTYEAPPPPAALPAEAEDDVDRAIRTELTAGPRRMLPPGPARPRPVPVSPAPAGMQTAPPRPPDELMAALKDKINFVVVQVPDWATRQPPLTNGDLQRLGSGMGKAAVASQVNQCLRYLRWQATQPAQGGGSP